MLFEFEIIRPLTPTLKPTYIYSQRRKKASKLFDRSETRTHYSVSLLFSSLQTHFLQTTAYSTFGKVTVSYTPLFVSLQTHCLIQSSTNQLKFSLLVVSWEGLSEAERTTLPVVRFLWVTEHRHGAEANCLAVEGLVLFSLPNWRNPVWDFLQSWLWNQKTLLLDHLHSQLNNSFFRL